MYITYFHIVTNKVNEFFYIEILKLFSFSKSCLFLRSFFSILNGYKTMQKNNLSRYSLE